MIVGREKEGRHILAPFLPLAWSNSEGRGSRDNDATQGGIICYRLLTVTLAAPTYPAGIIAVCRSTCLTSASPRQAVAGFFKYDDIAASA